MGIGATEARDNFSRPLDEVETGRSIVITRRGTPVARLVPVSHPSQERIRETIEQLRAFRRGRSLGGIKLHELIDEGRRY